MHRSDTVDRLIDAVEDIVLPEEMRQPLVDRIVRAKELARRVRRERTQNCHTPRLS
jgi:hypothetical protein